MSDTPAPPAPRPARRRWRRLLRWFFLLMTVLVIAFGAGLWWAWKNQTAVVSLLLARLPMPVKVELESLDGNWDRVLITGLKVSDKTGSEEIATVPELTWKPEWENVHTGELGELEVKGLSVSISQKTLGLFASAPGKSTSSSKSMPFQLSKLSVQGAKLNVEASDTMPRLSLELDHESTGLRFDQHPLPCVQTFDLALKNIRLDDDALVLPGVKLAGSLDAAKAALHLTSVAIEPVELKPPAAFVQRIERLMEPAPDAEAAEPALRELRIDKLELPRIAIDTGTLANWPKVTGDLAFHSESFHWVNGGVTSMGTQKLTLSQAEIRPPAGEGIIRLPKLEMVVRSDDVSQRIEVETLQLDQPVIKWASGLEQWLMPEQSESTGGSASTDMPAIALRNIGIDAASLSLSKTAKMELEGHAKLTLRAGDLRIDGQSLRSATEQSLVLTDVSLSEHPTSREQALAAFLTLKRGELLMIPDDWMRNQRLKKLALDGVKVTMLPDNTTFLKPTPPPAGTPKTAPPADSEPLWQKLKFDQLAITESRVDASYTVAHRVDVSAALELRTEPYKSMDGNAYHTLVLKSLRVNAPELADAPVTSVDEVSATLEWPAMWKTQRIESLRVRGGELDVNDVVKQLTGASPSTNAADKAPPPAEAPAPPATSNWRINRLAIADTFITLHRLAPGLPPVKFAVNYDVWDMPLQPKQLIGRLEPQKIELKQLSLRSPFNPLREVAVMNTIFVHFTLDGLLAGRIDRVAVLNPTLYVGEDLFWYVDYYRKYAAGEIPPDGPAPRMVSSDTKFAFDAAGDINVAPPGDGGWTVGELAVSGGKLVIAPKGVPLPGIPRPFPFSFVTRLEDGKFQAELEIPSDTYTWEKLKLEFQNLRGHVLFNLPHKQVSNNLTETFQVDVIRYKQLHMEESFLTVTYDAAGIYGQFGGKAYEGYVQGAFNIYNDTSFTWDGWLAGTGVRTTEITQKMTPTYLLLDGKVDATVVAMGNMSEVYQTDLKFTNTEPGKFSITTLNSAIESIPTDIPGYMQDLTRIGIETVRDFDYEKAEASARFYGREGRGHLRLSGPHGTRNIEVNVFDHRWKVTKPTTTTSSATIHASE